MKLLTTDAIIIYYKLKILMLWTNWKLKETGM